MKEDYEKIIKEKEILINQNIDIRQKYDEMNIQNI